MGDVQTLRWCGAAGIFGAALLLAADWVMLGTFTSGREFNERWYVLLADVPRWRVLAGGLAGPVGAWFYVVGFWQLYLALKPAGKRLAFLVFAGFSMSFIWAAAAFHTSFPLMADAWQAREAAGGAITESAFGYFGLLFYAGLAPSALGTVLLAYAVLCRPTRYPRWFAALNPGLFYLLTWSFAWVPAPLGGLMVVGAGNLVFLTFFAASTALLRDGGRGESPAVGPPNPTPLPPGTA